MTNAIIHTESLHRIYRSEEQAVHAISDVTLDIPAGKMTAIVGRSGAGKTTLLNLISGLDTPTEGGIWVKERAIHTMPEGQRTTLRRESIGYIFQNFGLLPLLSAAENVSIPLRMRGVDYRTREHQVREALEWVGLTRRAGHRPYELSGGEQQRVAIARALAARPEIILADEPTGQLDSQTGARVLDTMRRLVDELGLTVVIVTHDPQAIDAADSVHRLHDGHLQPPDSEPATH